MDKDKVLPRVRVAKENVLDEWDKGFNSGAGTQWHEDWKRMKPLLEAVKKFCSEDDWGEHESCCMRDITPGGACSCALAPLEQALADLGVKP